MSQPKRYKFFKHIDYKLMEIDAQMIEWSDGNWVDYSDYAAIAAENEVLRNKVEWLRQAEHLVIWDGERWKVRQEMLPK